MQSLKNLVGIGQGSTQATWQFTGNTFPLTPGVSVKRIEILEFKEDVLALSCAWYRNRELNQYPSISGISRLTDEALFNLVEEQDRVHADEIRDYYSKKFMIWILLGKHLTAFRTDLKHFISGSKYQVLEKMLPLAYRLPEFYLSDVSFDAVKTEWTATIPDNIRDARSCSATIIPVKRLAKSSGRHKRLEYWFKDQNGYAYLIVIANTVKTHCCICGKRYLRQISQCPSLVIEQYISGMD